ncbi:MAG: hypothetical protein R3B71_04640 [Candidatus Gracilibacteria bacterium]|nr:hypothetical protein [Candidatus Peregrinibacteria bacterium]
MKYQTITDIIRQHFLKNNFYAYRLHQPQIAEKLLKEYQEVSSPSNKRNLCLDKFWSEIHSFGESREIIAIDLGGTNLNIFKVQVKNEKEIEVTGKHSTPFYEDKIYTPEALFTDLQKEIDKFVTSSKERANLKSIVFIFSFPIEQLTREDGYVDAICTFFGKTRKSEGIVGLQVGQAFQNHLRENGYTNVSVSVTNDTPIYSLAAKGHEIMSGESFDASMNIIVGTGMNVSAAYDEKNMEECKGLRVINTECGDFKGVELSTFDEKFKELNDTPDRYLTEKMMSGAWLSQVFGVIINDLLENKIITKEDLHNIDHMSVQAKELEDFIADPNTPQEKKTVVEFVWREINKRGGATGAMVLAGMMSELTKILEKDKINLIIMETGSVLSKGYRFREAMIDTIDSEVGRRGLSEKVEYTFLDHPHQSAIGAVIFDTFFSQ